jgi:RNA polymerase sigma-70 factor (ECF subfamily)
MDSSVNTVLTPEEEMVLIATIQAGQSAKFEILVENYQRRIYATLLAMLGNRQDAEDITQDTFITAFRKIKQYEQRSSFYTWLHRIAFNLAIDLQRKQKRTTKKCVGDQLLETQESSESQASTPDAITIAKETGQLVQLAMSRLEPERRNIIALRDLQGLDYSDIAAMLDLPLGTVRSRLHRARLELKDIMESMGMGPSCANQGESGIAPNNRSSALSQEGNT